MRASAAVAETDWPSGDHHCYSTEWKRRCCCAERLLQKKQAVAAAAALASGSLMLCASIYSSVVFQAAAESELVDVDVPLAAAAAAEHWCY